MSAGYWSYGAFWIGGLSAPNAPVPPPTATGGIQLVIPKYPKTKQSTQRPTIPIRARKPVEASEQETNHLQAQIRREDEEINAVISVIQRCF